MIGAVIMANEQNLKKITSTEQAREMQKKSAKKRAQNRKETKLIKDRILERMGEDDWDTMIDNLIARANEDTKSFETLRDTIGQKPVDKVVVDVDDKSVERLHKDFDF
jgi:hypothetical protein